MAGLSLPRRSSSCARRTLALPATGKKPHVENDWLMTLECPWPWHGPEHALWIRCVQAEHRQPLPALHEPPPLPTSAGLFPVAEIWEAAATGVSASCTGHKTAFQSTQTACKPLDHSCNGRGCYFTAPSISPSQGKLCSRHDLAAILPISRARAPFSRVFDGGLCGDRRARPGKQGGVGGKGPANRSARTHQLHGFDLPLPSRPRILHESMGPLHVSSPVMRGVHFKLLNCRPEGPPRMRWR
jgi:hypothetical protein